MKQFYILVFILFISRLGFGQVIDDDFEDGDLTGWTQGTASDWINSTTSPINGSQSLKHNLSGVSGSSYIYQDITTLDLSTQDITWQFNLTNANWDPSSANKFWVYLTANETNLNSGTVDGYAVGVNLTGTSDILTLWKVTNGASDGAIITSTFNWDANDLIGIRVTRSSTGSWELLYDADGDFDSLTSGGTGINTDYSHDDNFGLSFTFSSTRAGLLWMDDITIEGTPSGGSCGVTLDTASFVCSTNTVGNNNDTVTIQIPYTGSDVGITNVTTTILGATIGGDSPASVSNGTIEITGLSEDDAWDLTLVGGNCDATTISGTIPSAQCDPPPPITTFWNEPFDNNSQYSVTLGGEGNDGTQDYFHITDGSNINESYSNIDGTFFACQDIDDGGWVGSANPSQLTWNSIDINGFSSLNFKGSFASNGGGIDAVDYVLIEYQIDFGGWQNLLAFENDGTSSNTSFLEDTDFNGNGDGTLITSNFSEFEKSIGATGFNLDIRITVSLNSGNEEIAFDEFNLEGTYNGLTYAANTWTPSAPDGTTGASNAIILDGKYDVTSSVVLNDVFVNPGAAIEVTPSGTLNANSLNLESNSTQYASFILDGTIAGNIVDNVTYRRFVNNNNNGAPGGNDLVASPLTGLSFFDFVTDPDNSNLFEITPPPNDDQIQYLFGPYDNTNSLSYLEYSIGLDAPFGNPDPSNSNYDNDEPITTGKGYRAATTGSNGATLTFRGGVNTGNITTTDFAAPGNAPIDKWNLVGNPYPSYLDAQLFLSTNGGSIDETVLDPNAVAIYGYNDNTDNSTTINWTIINNVQNNTINIAPGQGFFLASNNTGQIDFTTAMRLPTGGDDFIQGRATNVQYHLGLTLSKSSASYNTDIYFATNATAGLNPGYDAGIFGSNAPSFAIYTHLVAENEGIPMAIQALGETDYGNISISLGVNANQGEQLTFSINDNTLPSTVSVYLEDTVANTLTLLNTSNYILTPNSDLNGTGRFYLNFSDSALATPQNSLEDLSIYANDTEKTIVIAGQLLEPTMAKVYDIQGRIISSEVLNLKSRTQVIDMNHIEAGIYIVELTNNNLKRTKKVILR